MFIEHNIADEGEKIQKSIVIYPQELFTTLQMDLQIIYDSGF